MTPPGKRMTPAEAAAERIQKMNARPALVTERTPMGVRHSANRGVLGALTQTFGPNHGVEFVELDPKKVRVWALQGRLQDVDEAHVADLVESLRQVGQTTYAVVRPVVGDPNYTHEVVDGSRRRRACELAGLPLKAYSRAMTDREAAMVAQTSDNTMRHSPYEVGTRYQGWLDAGIVGSLAELADLVRGSKSTLSRQLNLALVPRGFLRLWGEHDRVPKPIYERLASLMAKAKQADRLAQVQGHLDDHAKTLGQEGKGATEAAAALKNVEGTLGGGSKLSKGPVRLERRGEDGKPVLAVTATRNQVGIKLAKSLSGEGQAELAKVLADTAAQWVLKAR